MLEGRHLREIRAFLSSPGDVPQERKIVREIAREVSAEPFLKDKAVIKVISWDDHDNPIPLLAQMTPQEAVDRFGPRPSDCEVVVVILWCRMGTPPPLERYKKPDGSPYYSGTEWEYEDAFRADPQPDILVYRCTQTCLADTHASCSAQSALSRPDQGGHDASGSASNG